MKPKTEEFLYFLLWGVDMFCRPTFRNLTDSYESWAYRNGLLRQLGRLENQRLVERAPATPEDRLYRLTEQGRLHVLGGRDPRERWAREWDGQWRLALFDVPTAQQPRRIRLLRYLRENGFGYLQKSVWITPDRLDKERRILLDGNTNVETLILLEARPCAGESDADIVSGAWDFDRINRRYAEYLRVLEERPSAVVRNEAVAKSLLRWAAKERETWLAAVTSDPLLPERLLPPDYLGKKAWHRRLEILGKAGTQIRSFRG